jgi:hypothetical protein
MEREGVEDAAQIVKVKRTDQLLLLLRDGPEREWTGPFNLHHDASIATPSYLPNDLSTHTTLFGLHLIPCLCQTFERFASSW